MNHFRFSYLARRIAALMGRPLAFFVAVALIVLWGLSGPLFGFSDTWQLVVNTATTIITFLMVFLIQNTQNRDTEAIQLKLDELIRATQGAHNALLDLEEIDDEQLARYQRSYRRLAMAARAGVNPTLNSRIDWTWFVMSQIAFGLTCGFIVSHTERIETMQAWSWESRAGLEGRRAIHQTHSGRGVAGRQERVLHRGDEAGVGQGAGLG